MRYLLDTHTLIWMFLQDELLSNDVRKIIQNPENNVSVSVVNFWEISIKYSLGKLKLKSLTPEMIYQECVNLGISIISLNGNTTSTFHNLNANYHRDPFDRMLIWQAISENFTLISSDKQVIQYKSEGLKTIW
jgi:PIN domain nuclease of toxin-antitoxin system